MQGLRTGLALLAFLAFAAVSQAAIGTVDMTWDNCAGPIDKTTSVAAPYSLFLTVIGHDEAHKGYDVRVIYGNASRLVPDAWRFDADGCPGSPLITQDVTSKACPPFHQNAGHALQIRKVEFSPPYDPYPTTLMRVLLANVYDPVTSVNSGTRYLLERIGFDLTYSVPGPTVPPTTCGGFEQTICFLVSYASFLDLDNHEKLFHRSSRSLSVSFNGPSTCEGAVPVQLKTWGSIKNQYRN